MKEGLKEDSENCAHGRNCMPHYFASKSGFSG